MRNTVVPESARANIEEIKAKVPELAKHLRDDHEAFDSSKPDPLDILTQAKTPITDGGLIQVEPKSSSSEEPESSSSAEIAGGAHDISVFDMQGHSIAEFRTMQGNELHVTLRQGAYLVKVAQGNRTLGIFKATRR